MSETHLEKESNPWAINLMDHPERADSKTFRDAKATFKGIMATLTGKEPYGPGPWQAHHGGSIWVYSCDSGWLLFRNTLGVEWSLQFLARPEAIDQLRQNALRLVKAFGETNAQLDKLGDKSSIQIVHTPIVDAMGVAVYVDSLWNSCIPLAAAVHVGTLSAKNPTGGGWHHYPEPIVAGAFIKQADYVYWVTDGEGKPAAVVPMAPRGSGDARVAVAYATPGTRLHAAHAAAHLRGKQMVLPTTHPMAKQAFAKQ